MLWSPRSQGRGVDLLGRTPRWRSLHAVLCGRSWPWVPRTCVEGVAPLPGEPLPTLPGLEQGFDPGVSQAERPFCPVPAGKGRDIRQTSGAVAASPQAGGSG